MCLSNVLFLTVPFRLKCAFLLFYASQIRHKITCCRCTLVLSMIDVIGIVGDCNHKVWVGVGEVWEGECVARGKGKGNGQG